MTAVQRGTANTQWRDYADVYLLTRRHDLHGHDLLTALEKVADYRETRLLPLAEVLDGYPAIAQSRWVAWQRKNRLDDRLPADFSELLLAVVSFIDPVLRQDGRTQTWTGFDQVWKTRPETAGLSPVFHA